MPEIMTIEEIKIGMKKIDAGLEQVKKDIRDFDRMSEELLRDAEIEMEA